MFLIDGHLDLSMNALEWNRDLTRPLEDMQSRLMLHDTFDKISAKSLQIVGDVAVTLVK